MSPPPSATTAPGYDGMSDMRPQRPSLSESYRTIAVPLGKGGFWRKTAAFAGPGYMVAVGYMDPGNWATDLAGGSAFGYTLLSVILLSNIMAMVLQSLSAKSRASQSSRPGWLGVAPRVPKSITVVTSPAPKIIDQ